ncbi:chorismate synthase [Sporolituus thermophilus]|uniref:Chorismate synthase n=1 Tax=Sporolituus thermophilus DSM 23256 TaxID=1123285 RepID=A0A1G7I8G3_9FIRM|nr:chorismate synthase [Sporolituus thermophilus]SDF08806.1 chorismate synthase [Sporolituus thermophilus DSM 23256]
MLRFLTAGESHGPALTAIIEGLPAGMPIDVAQINNELARRQRGYGRGGRMQIEQDRVEILSGVRFGVTIGSPVTLVIRNRDWENWRQRMDPSAGDDTQPVTAARPGHADLAGAIKYDRQDMRDILERASARETAARVAVGAVAKQLLQAAGITVISHVTNIGGIWAAADGIRTGDMAAWASRLQSSALNCLDADAEERMKEAIDRARQDGDTLGGIFEVVVFGVFPGLGSHVHWDRRLDARLAGAVMSIPAVKGVEVGAGFAYAALTGSQAHDEIFYEAGRGYYRRTNNAGGMEGGISNGENLIVRAVMKPIPTLMRPLASVDIRTKQAAAAARERSDVCAVPAAAVVGEAVVAWVLAEALLEKFGGDAWDDLQVAIDYYRRRIR